MADLTTPSNQPLELPLDKVKSSDCSSPSDGIESVGKGIAEPVLNDTDKDNACVDDADKDENTLFIDEGEAKLQAGDNCIIEKCEGDENKITDFENVRDKENDTSVKVADENQTLQTVNINNNENVWKTETDTAVKIVDEDKDNSESDENKIQETENIDKTVNNTALEIANEAVCRTNVSPVTEVTTAGNGHHDDNLGSETSINNPMEDQTVEKENSSNNTEEEATVVTPTEANILESENTSDNTEEEATVVTPTEANILESENTSDNTEEEATVVTPTEANILESENTSDNTEKEATVVTPTEANILESENTSDNTEEEATVVTPTEANILESENTSDNTEEEATVVTPTEANILESENTSDNTEEEATVVTPTEANILESENSSDNTEEEATVVTPTEANILESENTSDNTEKEATVVTPTEANIPESDNTSDNAAVEPMDDSKVTENDIESVSTCNTADDKSENEDHIEAAAEVPIEKTVEPIDNNKAIESDNAIVSTYTKASDKHITETENTNDTAENEAAVQHSNDSETTETINASDNQDPTADVNEDKSAKDISDGIRPVAEVVPVDKDYNSKASKVIEEADKTSEIENANDGLGTETAVKDAQTIELKDNTDTKGSKDNEIVPHSNKHSEEAGECPVSDIDNNLDVCDKPAVAGSEMLVSPSVEEPKEVFDVIADKLTGSTGDGVTCRSIAYLPDNTADPTDDPNPCIRLVIDESDDDDLQPSPTNKNKDDLQASSNDQATDSVLPTSTDNTDNCSLPSTTDQISDDVPPSSTDKTILVYSADKTNIEILPASTNKTKDDILLPSTNKTRDDLLPLSTNKTNSPVPFDWSVLGVQRCTNCKFTTDDEELYKNHVTTCSAKIKQGQISLSCKKGNPTKYTCNSCAISWINKAEFEEHVVCHVVDSPYLCITCKRLFQSRYLIEKHAKIDHPLGDSKCALHGMKKCRQYVSAVENEGIYSFTGKTNIPRTPRNQIKEQSPSANELTSNTSPASATIVSKPKDADKKTSVNIVDQNVTTVIATMPSPRPDLVKFTSVTSKLPEERSLVGSGTVPVSSITTTNQPGTQVNTPTTVTVTFQTIPPTTSATSLTTSRDGNVNTLFHVLDNQDGKFHPAPIPMKIQALMNGTTNNADSKAQTESASPYHVKQFKEFTTPAPQTSLIQPPTVSQGPVVTILNQPPTVSQQPILTSLNQPPTVSQQPILTSLNQPPTVSQQSVVTILNQPPTVSQQLTSLNKPTTVSQQPVLTSLNKPPTISQQPILTSLNQPINTVNQQPVFLIPIRPIIRLDQPGQQPALQQTNTFTPVQSTIPQPQPVINQPNPNQFILVQSNTTVVDPQNTQPLRPALPKLGGTGTAPTPSSGQTKTANSASPTQTVKMPAIHKPAPTVQLPPPPPYPKPDKTSPGQLSANTHKLRDERSDIVVKRVSGQTPATINLTNKPSQPAGKDRTFTFRIKPQKGFVCECCKKYTRDELVFRKHVWEHFHVESMSCKYCNVTDKSDRNKKGVVDCKLLNEIVCKLVKNTVNTVNIDENLVIDITDDDDDDDTSVKEAEEKKKKKDESKAVEVIIVDDDDGVDENDLNIKISAPYSLTGTENLEKMSKDSDKSPDVSKAKKEAESPVTTSKPSPADKGGNEHSLADRGGNEHSPADKGGNEHSTADKGGKERSTAGKANDEEEDMDTAEADDKTDEGLETSKTDLVNKTLGTKEIELDNIVSQAIDYIFGDTIKMNNRAESDIINDNSDSRSSNDETLVEYLACHQNNSEKKKNQSSESSDKVDSMKVKFESEILASQSHNAFYMCGYENCNFSCLTSVNYKEHVQAKHTKEFNYICCHCGRKDYNEESHMRHVFSHSSPKVFYLYQCPMVSPMSKCKFKTNLPHMYLEHLKKHQDLDIICVYCHKTFSTPENLITHLNQNLLKFVSCPHCPFKFAYKEPVLKHIKLFHVDKPRMVTVTCQIVCQEREINFYVEPLVRQTMDKDGAKTANTDTVSITALLDEVQKDNLERKENDVDVTTVTDDSSSKKITNTADSLRVKENNLIVKFPPKKKTKTNIVGPKSLKCPHCSYLSYNLALHVQHTSLHQGEPEREKRFVCNVCPKGSDNIKQFKKHVANHIGRNEVKVFSCTSCMYNSNQKCHIMDHCSENHNGKGMYVQSIEEVQSSEHTCKYCDFKARQYEHVSQHEEAVHRVKGGGDGMPVVSGCGLVTGVIDKPASSKSEKNKKLKYHCEYCKNYFKHKADLKGHMEKDHADIEHKQFVFYKCKYCSHTSTMKAFIVAHIEKTHPGSELRILRKIESVEFVKGSKTESVKEGSKPQAETEHKAGEAIDDGEANQEEDIAKEKIGIPDGKTFKHPFPCPKCSFSSNLRIKVMRHIKCHPELVPVRESQLQVPKSISKPTARKTTGGAKRDFSERRPSALFQDVPSSYLHNPFTSLKNDIIKPSSKPTGSNDTSLYILGEKELHAKLSACFIPLEKDVLFRCRICQQKIAKMFVLHRHILNHLEIVFFKCRYCDEGSIEKTLLFGHIQKEHPQKPLDYSTVCKEELDVQIKEKIFAQNFNDSVTIETSSENTRSPLEMAGIIMKPVHESVPKVANGQKEKKPVPENTSKPEDSSKLYERTKRCPKCRYTTYKPDIMKKHIAAHSNPAKRFVCTICDYRGPKLNAVRHSWSVHGSSKCMIEEKPSILQGPHPNKEPTADTSKLPKTSISKDIAKDSSEKREGSVSSVSSVNSSKGVTGGSTKSKSCIMQTLYKCKECGLCRKSISCMYKHLKDSKACNKPVYKCSFCTYKSGFKTDVTKHRKLRHPRRMAAPIVLPVKAKIRTVKIPILSKRKSPDPASTSDSRSSSQEAVSGIRCRLCPHSCDTTMTLQFHINTKHGGKMLYCQECPYKTPLVKHMINHCTNVHMQKQALYKLQPKGSPDKTSDDDDSSIASSSLNEDSKRQIKVREKYIFSCPKCDFESTRMSVFKRHIYTHFSYRPYHCQICLATLAGFDGYKRHAASRHPGKPLKYKFVRDESTDRKVTKIMNHCMKEKAKHDRFTGASRPVKLDEMELVETGVRKDGSNFYCDFCGTQHSKKDFIIKHYQNLHTGSKKSGKKRSLNTSDTEVGRPPKKMPKLERETADNLDIRTSDSSDMEEESDLEKMLPVKYSVVMGEDGKRKFKCPQCDYKTDHKKYLQKHLKGHTSHQFKCFYCYFSSKWTANTYRHVLYKHRGMEAKIINMKTKKVSTSQRSPVPKSSPSVADVKTEAEADVKPKPVKHVKSKDIVYCCSICTYKRKGLRQFRRHLAYHPKFTTVTARRRYNCGYCSYTASSNLDYSAHRLTHLEDRRFKCAYCDFTAFIRTVVLKHTNRSHPDKRETCIDRESDKIVNETIVQLDPEVVLERLRSGQIKSKKFKRIKLLEGNSSDESADESSHDVPSDRVNMMADNTAEPTKPAESETVTSERNSNTGEDFEGMDVEESEDPLGETGGKEMSESLDVADGKGQSEAKTDSKVEKIEDEVKEKDNEECIPEGPVTGLEDVEMNVSE